MRLGNMVSSCPLADIRVDTSVIDHDASLRGPGESRGSRYVQSSIIHPKSFDSSRQHLWQANCNTRVAWTLPKALELFRLRAHCGHCSASRHPHSLSIVEMAMPTVSSLPAIVP